MIVCVSESRQLMMAESIIAESAPYIEFLYSFRNMETFDFLSNLGRNAGLKEEDPALVLVMGLWREEAGRRRSSLKGANLAAEAAFRASSLLASISTLESSGVARGLALSSRTGSVIHTERGRRLTSSSSLSMLWKSSCSEDSRWLILEQLLVLGLYLAFLV